MKYIIAGLILGAAVNLFVLKPANGIQFNAEWTGAIRDPGSIEKISAKKKSGIIFPVATSGGITLLNGAGNALLDKRLDDTLFTLSGNGAYYAAFKKVGSEVELFNSKGDRFWKLKSKEYPYLSRTGKLVLMLNGDQSAIRIFDIDSREGADKVISGRLCTFISFSEKGDNAAVGFLGGTFHVVNDKGKIIFSGSASPGNAVKSGSVSPDGNFAAFHCGNTKKDFLILINIAKNKTETAELIGKYVMKCPIHVSDDGKVIFIEKSRIAAFSIKGSDLFEIKIDDRREGYGSISRNGKYFAAGFTDKGGAGKAIFFTDDGDILFTRDFPDESFISASAEGDLLFLRGSDRVYCYSCR